MEFSLLSCFMIAWLAFLRTCPDMVVLRRLSYVESEAQCWSCFKDFYILVCVSSSSIAGVDRFDLIV